MPRGVNSGRRHRKFKQNAQSRALLLYGCASLLRSHGTSRKRARDMGLHSKPEGLKSFHDFSSVTVACVGLGASASLGSLAVPSGWPTATAASEPASLAVTGVGP